MLAKLISVLASGIGICTCRTRDAGVRASRAIVMPLLVSVFCVLLSYPAHPAAARSYPKLFGSYELQSANMQKFPKWNSMLARWKNGAPCESSTCTTKGWNDLINRLKGQDLATQMREVNREMNLHPYILDINNWGSEDYWETPFEFLKKSGDCEDYAIAKYMALRALGVPIDDMRVVALRDLNLQLGHAVLVVYVNNVPMMLDNQISSVVPANSIKHYQPVYSINEHNWWLHTR
ncbi:MAG TPA: transglutaminase-like cysteine peptidase [Terriglobia bacterium]|nr:transglutaminase-like cysteine peptidase [Terriglobia bacterium]